jgi:signal transduction histidine kinase
VIEVEGNPNVTINADRLILRHAIVNLLDNAIKYSPEESRMVIRVDQAPNMPATLDVIDQGQGIPIEHQPHVFDRFYRVDKARTREWGGAGLGLSIARWAVEAQGGTIALKTEEARGCTFQIAFPSAPQLDI